MSEFFDIKQASAYLGCHPVTLTKKAQASTIPAYKRLNKWLFKKEDLDALFKPNKAADPLTPAQIERANGKVWAK